MNLSLTVFLIGILGFDIIKPRVCSIDINIGKVSYSISIQPTIAFLILYLGGYISMENTTWLVFQLNSFILHHQYITLFAVLFISLFILTHILYIDKDFSSKHPYLHLVLFVTCSTIVLVCLIIIIYILGKPYDLSYMT